MAGLVLPKLIPLDQADPAAVERVLDAAFGPDRHKRTAYAIRKGTECLPPLCFAAFDGAGELVGRGGHRFSFRARSSARPSRCSTEAHG